MNITQMLLSKISKMAYAPVLTASMVLLLARNFSLAGLLSPQNFAAINASYLISASFCMLACFGLQALMQREVPLNISKGRECANLILLTQGILLTLFSATALVIASLFLNLNSLLSMQNIIFGLIHGAAQQVFLITSIDSRSRGNLVQFSCISLARAAAIFSIAYLLASLAYSPTMIIFLEAIITLLVSLQQTQKIFSAANFRLTLILKISVIRLAKLPWKAATLLLIFSLVTFFILNTDRWIAIYNLNVLDFAAYSFILILFSIAASFQYILSVFFYPYVIKKSLISSPARIRKICTAMSLTFFVSGALFSIPIYYFLKFSIENFYPQYNGISHVVYIALMSCVLRISDFWSTYCLALGQEKKLIQFNLIFYACFLFFWYLLVINKFFLVDTIIGIIFLNLYLSFGSLIASFTVAFLD
jgi:hypothetical protein